MKNNLQNLIILKSPIIFLLHCVNQRKMSECGGIVYHISFSAVKICVILYPCLMISIWIVS